MAFDNKSYQMKRRDALKQTGLCVQCGKCEAREGRVTCSKCAKKLSAASKKRQWDNVSNGRCKVCGDDSNGKTMCEKHSELKEENRILHKYGLTKEQLSEKKRQKKCEICGRSDKRLVIDHCHSTGEFRGMLCDKCNVGLHFIEDKKYGDIAREYIAKHERERSNRSD